MPKLSQVVDITVTENIAMGGKRSWNIVVRAGADLFLLTDTLAKEHAIRNIETTLRVVVRDAIVDYIESGRAFIKGVANQRKAKSE